MHPRPSPIAASLYTLRDLNADVIILHGPHGCCFRTGRLLENDGVRVVTTAMSENDFIFGASAKLEETLREADELFHPQLVGVVGTCASMIIGEDMREAVNNAGIPAKVLTVESHGGLSEGDNTEGAIAVLEAAQLEGVIPPEEAERQSRMLKKATEIEKTRGMAQGKYIAPSYGDDKEEVASALLEAFENGDKIVFVLNAKKETSYLFADLLKIPFGEMYPENKPVVIANLDLDTGLPRIRQHARNIQEELGETGLEVDIITGGLDEYPMTGEKAVEYLQKENFDLIVVAGVPHALPIEKLDVQSIAITDGPRLVEPLKNLGYTWVVTELDAHAKTLGTDKIVESDFGTVLRGIIAEK
ncbi:Ni-sirohydrochlorin a,c-diamide reductive cyclase catalytic subunit [Methanobacterium sp.]|uniref:Ni-sirohydrochlorin a,c-diamide reductive cyclase catalytic subunit n=1 Tax=Methanobacterium sp. TaxID=2164 RepID=UPI002600910D|nr:Ni-sirohydrochlorin a,c-diamide reductive cyclase catalytic subunit [Methanobacterium sp.]MBI5460004.1 Ni-sirohydrochlorin a,c-diamide reductive cyclase catalytic subunit [Methanobacterium sp.]MDY9924165.1 Ni-sirohydrochlorin a,c-diamide reductive cyclase catalytic subunit [Methanobacterium sp.]